ncbi:hypothetical protein Q4574_19165 [Aliiglaciecola sp. 3_MG-2023]|uniref:hypothetical protein n=1 Tax=Aliiglaciecola sp. 3_MG-2023 TaxID=3062644 RepID=UPI0026E15843|nr:hypothetical protein [Aliiglaciecola sp. 3_MG-2023]MDO6695427.1 hypothetical protein [Aliiglaciecola sp. 3_MG-2023]
MKKQLSILALLFIPTHLFANTLSDANPVMRNLTLNDNEILIGLGASYGTGYGENDVQPLFSLAYGVTDNLTIGPAGVRYAVWQRPEANTGWEVTIDGGLMGLYESAEYDDSYALGGGLSSKYVISKDFSIGASAHYLHWNEDKRDNKTEFRGELSAMWRVNSDLTVYGSGMYRELKDFAQDNAYALSTGLIWNPSKQMDVILDFTYTDFDSLQNGYDIDAHFKRQYGLKVIYRF